MIPPTKKTTRKDSAGDGAYGSSRGKRIHTGRDYDCDYGQMVYAPFDCHIVRIAFPYANDTKWKGLILSAPNVEAKIFYIEPDIKLVGKAVNKGWPIGKAQDISQRYPGQGMKPHIHFEITSIDPDLLMRMP